MFSRNVFKARQLDAMIPIISRCSWKGKRLNVMSPRFVALLFNYSHAESFVTYKNESRPGSSPVEILDGSLEGFMVKNSKGSLSREIFLMNHRKKKTRTSKKNEKGGI